MTFTGGFFSGPPMLISHSVGKAERCVRLAPCVEVFEAVGSQCVA